MNDCCLSMTIWSNKQWTLINKSMYRCCLQHELDQPVLKMTGSFQLEGLCACNGWEQLSAPGNSSLPTQNEGSYDPSQNLWFLVNEVGDRI